MARTFRERESTERNSNVESKWLSGTKGDSNMELQDGTGAQAGSRGTMTGLTDLFTHLSHIEHSKNIVDKIKGVNGREFLITLLDTYPHLPQQIKNDIIAYRDNATQQTVDVIKQHAANEVQRIWDILGIC